MRPINAVLTSANLPLVHLLMKIEELEEDCVQQFA